MRQDSLAIEINYDIKQVEYKTELLATNKRYSVICIFIGIMCSVFGFFLWYHRSQKYLDKKVKNNS